MQIEWNRESFRSLDSTLCGEVGASGKALEKAWLAIQHEEEILTESTEFPSYR